MNELLNKISSYHVFNYLLPGVIFVAVVEKVTPYSVGSHDILTGAFIYYFLGLVISRFGSLVIEPLLHFLSFLKYAPYKDFVAASQKDAKIAVLSEVNNTYRTLASLFALLLLLKAYVKLEGHFPFLKSWNITIGITLLLLMFLFSHRKQAAYIVKRIEANAGR